MTPRTHPRRRRVAGVGVLLAGCLLLVGCQAADQQPASGAPTPTHVAGGRSAGGRPVSIEIPAVGVDASVVPVGLLADGTMEVPAVDQAGWYEPGPRPGEAGPAVLVGHVDSRRGPAVFFRLQELRPGHRSFLVERVERQPKEDLPVGRIWNRTGRPALRLITCGGSFDRGSGHYRDNIIVYASTT
jgi:Sortase domain